MLLGSFQPAWGTTLLSDLTACSAGRVPSSFGSCVPLLSDGHHVMNQLDPIKELYNMYSEEEDTPRIVEVGNDNLDFDLDIEGPADPYMDL